MIETATGQVGAAVERPGGLKAVPSTIGERVRSPWRAGLVLLVLLAVAVGVAGRLWFLFHRPVTSDEAIAGLMASQILHGHFSAFYWGQVYGGGEPYLTAASFGIAGHTVGALKAIPVILAAVAALLTWRVTKRLVAVPLLAGLAAALVWVGPQDALGDSTVEWGFRGLTLVVGLALLLVALRIHGGQRHPVAFGLLGLLVGFGWWSSPEIVYYLLPAGFLLVMALYRDRDPGRWVRWGQRLGVLAVAAGVGALPWIWANVGSGLKSVRSGSFAVPPGSPGYFGRLDRFFHYVLPMLFSLRENFTGTWLGGRVLGVLLAVVLIGILVVAVLLCAARDDTGRAVAVGVVGFPFLLAVSPATWFWGDGRYAIYLVPLIAMALAIGCAEGWRRSQQIVRRPADTQPFAAALMGVLLVGTATLNVVNFNTWVSPVSSYLSGWSNPNLPSIRLAQQLEREGIKTGYADYWVAYRLDLLSNNRLQLTVAGTDVDRWPALDRKVRSSRSDAWLFMAPTAAALRQFGETVDIQGPGGLSEANFLADLKLNSIRYRIVRAGSVQAVIPSPTVTPAEVGLVGTG